MSAAVPHSPAAASLIDSGNMLGATLDVINEGMADIAWLARETARFEAFNARLASGEWIDPVEQRRMVDEYRAFKVRRQALTARWRPGLTAPR